MEKVELYHGEVDEAISVMKDIEYWGNRPANTQALMKKW